MREYQTKAKSPQISEHGQAGATRPAALPDQRTTTNPAQLLKKEQKTTLRPGYNAATCQLVGDPPTQEEIAESVKQYKASEAKAATKWQEHKDAQSKLGKDITKAHKSGAPMPEETQKERQRAVASIEKEAKQLTKQAQQERRASDALHNKVRAKDPERANNAQYGGGQGMTHQGAGSAARKGPNSH